MQKLGWFSTGYEVMLITEIKIKPLYNQHKFVAPQDGKTDVLS